MPQYYLLSYVESKMVYTRDGREQFVPDWSLIAGPFASRDEAEQQGLEALERQFPSNPICPSIERETARKNRLVVPAYRLRQYHIDLEEHE